MSIDKPAPGDFVRQEADRTKRENKGKTAQILQRVEGLESTLYNWVNVFSESESPPPPLSFDQVVKHMADNREVRGAVKSFFSYGGAGYEADVDPANLKREELAWALVEEFEKRADGSK